ncbi:exosortase-dependent surface protein XDP1 [Nitrogeniibacter aestuarii]|uniref:exosortase-dependent surface protein XDP1 n=1 Tax=Nitrogeniibacter aestuarii TaxID=2815343 RepID=UPI001D101C8A|nr:exosortase-dependent surface protein XDP1 [Nitrogeniibacter aestuarii]
MSPAKLRALLALTAVMAGPAMAATEWNFSGDNNNATWANTRSFTSNGITVTASAWANTSGTANQQLETAYLSAYGSSGLGVINRDGYSSSSSDKDYNDVIGDGQEHSMDNDQRYDSILLSFSEAVNVAGLRNGWYSGDSDLSVMAYLGAGAPSLSGLTYSNLTSNGWVGIADLSDVGTSWGATNSTTFSSYWLVGAFNPAFNGNTSWSTGNDMVKLAAVSANVCTGVVSNGTCGQQSTGVPEPGSLALAGLGLLGVLGMRRRRS